ncbi:TonB-dependent receptor [Arcticibacter tournemirensis]|uniref:SusC/RagA family TonB-linked outer membrane protein n=1 Tax=Arcticibacter tournemirensis TaxID=699437 RepID=A0A4Q0M6L8_9SPHI|nr:TonB-dependent receptor [Arcticibacter tournemirensis]RXF68634.1 SusC/RagA family TonB-linked outer membrane protein [Arcticibacter tournemirensis]
MQYNSILLKIMRISLIQIFLFGTLVGSSLAREGKAQEVLRIKVTLNEKDVSLERLLSKLEETYNVSFVYSPHIVDSDRKVSISAKGSTLSEMLQQVLPPMGLTFNVTGEVIVIKSSSESQAEALRFTVSGTVTDQKTGDPLPGVSVKVKGSTLGTVTNIQGKYSIDVPGARSVLVFSFVGFENEELEVSQTAVLNVVMKEKNNSLEEVVVVGYGTQKKVNVIGSVATINSKTIENRSATTLSSSLSGLAAGVYVRTTTGKPGADGASIMIRGTGTISSTSPLVVIDGIVGSMDAVNPNDVDNISILKDAATAAIYGSAASNGVILITTKKGNKGKTNITYTGLSSIAKPNDVPEFITDYATHMRLVNEGYRNIGQAAVYTDATITQWEDAKANPNDLNEKGFPNYAAYPNTDWANVVFDQNKLVQNHNLTLNGGTETTQYLMSAGYLNNPGTMPNTGADKYRLRVNLQSKVAKFLTLGTQTFGDLQKMSVADMNTVYSYLVATVPGVYPQYNGLYGFPAAKEESVTANNPLASLYTLGGKNRVSRVNTTIFANIDILKGLNFETKVHYDNAFTENNTYSVPQERWNFATGAIGQSAAAPSQLTTQYSLAKGYNVIIDNVLRYNTTIRSKHDIGAILGYNQQYSNQYNFNASKKGLLDPSLTTLTAGSVMNSIGGTETDWGLRSYFGRVNYAYKQRYLAEAVMRYDGSSKFGPDSKWGLFPAFSVGWRLSDEPFLSGLKRFADDLKLRASWGKTGSNGVSEYEHQAAYSSANYSFNGGVFTGLAPSKSGNSDLHWETTTTSNIGLSGTTFKGAMNFDIDVYKGFTSGILFIPTIPRTVGTVVGPTKNIAEVTKKGLELTLGYNGKLNKLRYSISGNFAYNTNKVDKYKGKLQEGFITDASGNQVYSSNLGTVSTGGNTRIIEGHTINEYYLYPVYKGSGTYSNADGSVNVNGGPKDGMIRTAEDMDWLQKMVAAGHRFQPADGIANNKIWYGDLIYADSNGDGIYGNVYDQQFTGKNSAPNINYGLNLNASYKGFDLSMIWSGSAGMSYYWSVTYLNQSVVGLGKAVSTMIANNHYYYNEANPNDPANTINARYPRLKSTDAQNGRQSNYYLYNASYVKLRNFQLGYSIPNKITRKLSMSSVRVYVAGENLLTISDYPGQDPEVGPATTGTGLIYPTMRQYSLGLNVTF